MASQNVLIVSQTDSQEIDNDDKSNWINSIKFPGALKCIYIHHLSIMDYLTK